MHILKRNKWISLLLVFLFISTACVTIHTKDNLAQEYYNLANDYYKAKNYTKAITLYKKALEYNPKFNEAKINLIFAYQKQKQYENASNLILKEYKANLSDYNQKLLLLLGNNYFIQNSMEKAIQIFTEYIKAYPEDHKGYFNLGLVYYKIGNSEEAIRNFFKSYEINNKYVPALFNIADYYYNIEDNKNSLYYYQLLIELEKKNPVIFYKLGILEYNMKEYENAEKHFLEALKLKPEDPEYAIWLSRIYAWAYKDKKKTLEYLEKGLENGYENPGELVNLEEFKVLKQLDEFDVLIKKYLSKNN